MKMSSKMERCGLSPMRKFNPLANEALARGIKIYHMNIGQPDVETPAPFFQALRDFAEPVVSYAPAPGIPELLARLKKAGGMPERKNAWTTKRNSGSSRTFRTQSL